jgi:hypothetical protein
MITGDRLLAEIDSEETLGIGRYGLREFGNFSITEGCSEQPVLDGVLREYVAE